MLEAKESKIILERCHRGIKEIQIAMPNDIDPIFRYNRPNRLMIGDHPKLMDPFSKKNVFAGDTKTKGEGLFAKKEIKKDDFVVYYSGLLWNETEQALYTREI